MSDPRADRLQQILRRALHRAALHREAKERLRKKSEGETVAEDYAKRLAEKSLYRRLLAEYQMDALRFKWYFTHIKKDTPLEELRCWIDHKIIEEDTHARHTPQVAPHSPASPASRLV